MSIANAGYGIDKKGKKTFETFRVITFEFKLYIMDQGKIAHYRNQNDLFDVEFIAQF